MRTEDRAAFTQLIAATMDVFGRNITTGFVDIFFTALSQYDLATVREAMSRHIQDPEAGRFAPKPADLIRQIVTAKASDGRPGKDEAWAIAQRAQDEAETVVITEEILGALAVAQPLLDMRDKVAARMAFIEAYERLVTDNRARNVPFEWQVSLGTDKARRISAIEQAKVNGLLPAPKAELLLEHQRETPITAEGLAITGLLTGGKCASSEELRSKWHEVRESLEARNRDRKTMSRQARREAEAELNARKDETE